MCVLFECASLPVPSAPPDRLGTSGVAATTADILVQPADSVILQVPKGITHIAYIQGVAAGAVNVVPLENS